FGLGSQQITLRSAIVAASVCSRACRQPTKFIALQSIEKGEWCRDLCRYQLSRHRDSGRTCLRRKLRLVHESEPELRGGARQGRRTDGGGTQKAGRLPA